MADGFFACITANAGHNIVAGHASRLIDDEKSVHISRLQGAEHDRGKRQREWINTTLELSPEIELCAMKASKLLLLLAIAPPIALSQHEPGEQVDQVTSKEFLQQLIQDGVYLFIAPKVAESLVTQRTEPNMPHGDMVARVSGTVIIAFEITKDGKVRHPMAVSGPKLLQAPVLAAVRQWKFKPYTINGEAVTVATSIPLTVSNF
jgi:TonB family protein